MQPADCADTGYTNTCAIGEQDCPTGEQPNSDLSACAVNATDVSVFPTRPGNGLLIGQFKLADGRTGVYTHHCRHCMNSVGVRRTYRSDWPVARLVLCSGVASKPELGHDPLADGRIPACDSGDCSRSGSRAWNRGGSAGRQPVHAGPAAIVHRGRRQVADSPQDCCGHRGLVSQSATCCMLVSPKCSFEPPRLLLAAFLV